MKEQVISIFRILSYQKTVEFYIDWLGFTIDWEHRFGEDSPIYMQISKEFIILHLSEHLSDCTPGGKVFIEYPGIAEFHRWLSEKSYNNNKPCLERAPWEPLTMELIDPFGNKLLFSKRD